jgi:hypothetical protein
MRTIPALLAFLMLCGYSCTDEGNSSTGYRDLSQTLSVREFENIKSFILDNGDRQTYCNMYSDNPHYSFERFEAWLNPETGQRNINCDPEISDFNEIVLRDQDPEPQYFYILIIRRGDLEDEDIWYISCKMMTMNPIRWRTILQVISAS